MGELWCGGVAVWGNCGVEELQCGGVAVWESRGVILLIFHQPILAKKIFTKIGKTMKN